MVNFFKKLAHGANNIFKKLDSGSSNFFKKLPDEASKVAGQIGSGLNTVGDGIASTAKKAGNFLEKNSAILADVGAGIALASGVGAEFAPGILAAGNSGAILGQRLKNSGSQAQNSLNNLAQIQQRTITNTAQQASGAGMRNLGQARVMVNDANNTLNNLASATNGLNNLTLH